MKSEPEYCPDHFEKDFCECIKAANARRRYFKVKRIHFGKYKGTALHHLTNDYILWLLTQDWLDEKTRKDLSDVIAHRDSLKGRKNNCEKRS